MCPRIVLAIFVLSINAYTWAQRTPQRGWTDKNNVEQYAAYMIQLAYYELGYLGARVQIREDGPRRTFEVNPGRKYRIKSVQILGESLSAEAMAAMPNAGDVYSDAAMNEWIATLQGKYQKTPSWSARFDPASAFVTIEVDLDAHSTPAVK